MKYWKYICVSFLFCLIYSGTFAQSAQPIKISTRVSNDTVRIGDVFTYTAEVEWAEEVEIKSITVGEDFGIFEVRKVHPPVDTRTDTGRNKRIYSYELVGFETGEYEIPAFTIKYIGPDGKEKEASSAPVKIKVVSVLPSSSEASVENLDIRPLKPPIEIPPDYNRLYRFIAFLSSGIILAGLGFYLWHRYLRRKKASGEEAPEILRPPEEIAKEELLALKNSSLLNEGKIKEYYSRVADIIRIYLGRRFNLPAIDMTSFELLYALQNHKNRRLINEQFLEKLEQFLEECDLVKFAKYVPPEDRWEKIIDIAFELIEMTTPQEKTEVVVASAK